MKITKIEIIKDCFDGEAIRELFFDKQISKEFIYYMGKLGDLKYFSSFAKPFFKIIINDNYILKGAEGNFSLKAHGKGKTISEFLNIFELFISQYQ